MKTHNQKFDMIIRGIVMTRGENGATIEEMRSDYFKMFCEHWPLKCKKTDHIVQYLVEIHGLMMERLDTGLCIWYIDDIGSNLSDRQIDSNNNANVAGQSDSSGGEVQNDSNGFVAPLMRRKMLISAFVSGTLIPSLSSSSTTTTSTSSAIITASSVSFVEQNERETDTLKRRHSHDSCPHEVKRIKSTEADRLPLIEQNLNMHNWNSATNGTAKQVTTSTEKENSILAPNGAANGGIDAIECIEEIEVVSDSEYQAPIKDIEMKKLQK